MKRFPQLAPRFPRLRLVLVPRHPERFDAVGRLLDQSGVAWVRRSHLPDASADSGEAAARVLLVDTVGELGAWWGTAHIAFVGGSLGSRGGQNMIEPAAYGAAVSFGPNTRNFRDIVASLLACNAAVVVANRDELTAFVRRCLEEPDWAEQLGRRAQEHVCRQLGATERTVELLLRLPVTWHSACRNGLAAWKKATGQLARPGAVISWLLAAAPMIHSPPHGAATDDRSTVRSENMARGPRLAQ